MTDYVEGCAVLEPTSSKLHAWQLVNAPRRITLVSGSRGFCLAFVADRFDTRVERLDQPGERDGAYDDGGYSHRAITGGSGWSKHATGCAEDLNWRLHPYNTRASATFTRLQIEEIGKILRDSVVDGLQVIEWGGNWPSHPGSTAKPDPMHFQISSAIADDPITPCEELAERWMKRARGRALLEANPGQLAVIRSKVAA